MEKESDLYRPQFHFTPPSGWMNDPNGLVYYQNEYHLFYQYITDLNRHGELHWGHAISPDLIHWRHQPAAIYPDNEGEIWSGSAVVDKENTAGFRYGSEKALIALFTQTKDGEQKQGLAFSIDKGRNWDKFIHNPVIANPGLKDFRDPKVFWYEPDKHWVMALAAGDRILFYVSSNLKEWRQSGEFGSERGCHTGIWECPDLFCLPYKNGNSQRKWILLVSVTNGAPNGGSGVQYFIGRFDGKTFVSEYPVTQTFWLDYGRDNYAAITFSDIPAGDGRRILLGWMNNWQYARDLPTYPWKGAMTLPRELLLRKGHSGPVLISQPVRELKTLRKENTGIHNLWIEKPRHISLGKNSSTGLYEINIEYMPESAGRIELVFSNMKGDSLLIRCDHESGKIYIDRRRCGRIDFHEQFAADTHSAELIMSGNSVKLHIFLDRSSAEVFLAEGQTVLTELIFPQQPFSVLKIRPEGGRIHLQKCDIWTLKSTGQA